MVSLVFHSGWLKGEPFRDYNGQFLLRDFGFEKPTPGPNCATFTRTPGGFAQRLTLESAPTFYVKPGVTLPGRIGMRRVERVRMTANRVHPKAEEGRHSEPSPRQNNRCCIPCSPHTTAVAIVHTSSSKGGGSGKEFVCPLGPVPL